MKARLVTLVLGSVWVLVVLGQLPEQGRRENKLRGLRVAIGPDVAKERCREVVANIKVAQTKVYQNSSRTSSLPFLIEIHLSDNSDTE